MRIKELHIVSFDVPFPANYGGAIDVFYRLKALHKLGIKITFHCFEYGRGQQKELEKYADKVHYYSRKKSVLDSLGKTPFIVKSRASKELVSNLCLDNSPILFEGLHCCFFLDDSRLKNRTKIVRTHNIEHDYYSELAKRSSGLKKSFYKGEAKKLKAYESQLKNADYILAIKQSDADHFKQYSDSVLVLDASSKEVEIKKNSSTEPYFLFHGNLSVEENETGAKWLIENVFPELNQENKFKIAGKDPSSALKSLCEERNVELISNPSAQSMDKLIQGARVHLFYSEQNTGVKLKLVNAMASSGHIVVNENMISGTQLGEFVTLAENKNSFIKIASEKIKLELSQSEFEVRILFLKTTFSTENNCQKIIDII